MTLKDLFDFMQAGELRLTSWVEDGFEDAGVREQVLALTKRGLTALHTRFKLRGNTATLVILDEVDTYTLDNSVAPGLLKIEEVYTLNSEGYPEYQNLNIGYDITSYRTPSANVLKLPVFMETRPGNVYVDYRQNHPDIPEDAVYLDPADFTIEIPPPFAEPLALFVAAKAHVTYGAGDGIDLGASLLSQYELACQKLEAYNMDNDTLENRDAFQKYGWI